MQFFLPTNNGNPYRNKDREVERVVNVSKLKGKIAECNLNMTSLAEKMGMNKDTLYRKVSGDGGRLTLSDILSISKILNLSEEEVFNIFINSEYKFQTLKTINVKMALPDSAYNSKKDFIKGWIEFFNEIEREYGCTLNLEFNL